MKKLLFKEFKLSMHPLCYVFTICFSVLAFIPNYPVFISTIYVIAAYTFLFLGANKGQSTNDLFYTVNLPIRRKDVVKARLLSMTVLQLMTLVPLILFLPLSNALKSSMPEGANQFVGFSGEHIIVLFGLIIIGYALSDMIYVCMFYKTGKAIIGPTLISMIVYVFYGSLTTICLPLISVKLRTLCSIKSGTLYVLFQILFLILSVGFYLIMRVWTNKIATKRLLKVDF